MTRVDRFIKKENAEEISFIGKTENRLYKISESSYVNADLNSSPNIGRKVFSEYTCTNLLNFNVIIVKHSDKCPDGPLKAMQSFWGYGTVIVPVF